MASLQQEHRGTGGSNNIVAVEVSPPSITTSKDCKDSDDQEDRNHQKHGWRNFLTYVGPGFLVSIAYIDPGNSTLDNPHWINLCSHNSIARGKSWCKHRQALIRIMQG
ncbi:hypothetical protein RJ640_005429 [Escallonia rubra]|uniref:Uncharacterized protein n=1 Tax=Escallonia rubra TaxID=112253 RepID=A0AA88U170_9ASTE|nr:hypothetical protein RJ640_005429 [Escallonia rubra]